MNGPNGETCLSCRFFSTVLLESDEDSEGWCYRFPPLASHVMSMTNHSGYDLAEFPVVLGYEWCGEWKAIAEAVDKRT